MQDRQYFMVCVPLRKGDDVYAFRPTDRKYYRVAALKVYQDTPGGYKHEALRPGDESDELIGIMSEDVRATSHLYIDGGLIRVNRHDGPVVGIVSHYPDYVPDGPEFVHLERRGGRI